MATSLPRLPSPPPPTFVDLSAPAQTQPNPPSTFTFTFTLTLTLTSTSTLQVPHPHHPACIEYMQVPEPVENLSFHRDTVVTALGAAPDDAGSALSGGWVMAAGTNDGQVLLFDARERGQQTVQRMKDHKGVWVVDVYFTAVRTNGRTGGGREGDGDAGGERGGGGRLVMQSCLFSSLDDRLRGDKQALSEDDKFIPVSITSKRRTW